jgi:hypothetical protein
MHEMLFPDEALAILREAQWDPFASRSYEIMSGGFRWSDECWGDVTPICMEQGSWAFRYVLGYRAWLIRGVPREELRLPWDQLLRACPEWPGFRPERCSPTLAGELQIEDQRTIEALNRWIV